MGGVMNISALLSLLFCAVGMALLFNAAGLMLEGYIFSEVGVPVVSSVAEWLPYLLLSILSFVLSAVSLLLGGGHE